MAAAVVVGGGKERICKREPPKPNPSRTARSLFFQSLSSLSFPLFFPTYRTTAFLAARYRAASTSGETAPALEALEEEQERISSSRRGIQSEAAASATIAPGALQIDAGKDAAAAGFCC